VARRGTVKQAVKGTTTSARKRTARPFAPKGFRLRASAGRVRITLPKLGKGERVKIQRSAATKKAKFGASRRPRRRRTSTAASGAGARTATAWSS